MKKYSIGKMVDGLCLDYIYTKFFNFSLYLVHIKIKLRLICKSLTDKI